MTLEELTERIDKLHALLHDPHPGLFPWCQFLGRGMGDLITRWQGGNIGSEYTPTESHDLNLLTPVLKATEKK